MIRALGYGFVVSAVRYNDKRKVILGLATDRFEASRNVIGV
jgi:hypothetical protein